MLKILIVEDDIITQDIIFNILKDDYDLYRAKNGKDGLAAFTKFSPEIVITDVNMPVMDGLEMTKEIRKIDKNCKIIVTTFKNDLDTLLKATELKLNKFLIKPLDATELKETIHQSKKEYEEFKIIKLKNVHLSENLVWDKDRYNLYLNNELIKLTPKEKKVLDVLLERPNMGISYDEIISKVWDTYESYGDKNSLKTIIKIIRQKIPDIKITNIHSFGYMISL